MTSLPYDVHDEALARATWSRLVEPADAAAAALVGHLGITKIGRASCRERV